MIFIEALKKLKMKGMQNKKPQQTRILQLMGSLFHYKHINMKG